MKDAFGREINYLRLSVTELCNLRCRYCMPEEGVCKLRHEDLLTEEEMLMAVRAAAGLGITKVNGSAVHYVSQFTRNPAPPVVVWDLATRAPSREITSFYWLKADPSADQGESRVMAGDENTVVITPKNVNGDFSILIHGK